MPKIAEGRFDDPMIANAIAKINELASIEYQLLDLPTDAPMLAFIVDKQDKLRFKNSVNWGEIWLETRLEKQIVYFDWRDAGWERSVGITLG